MRKRIEHLLQRYLKGVETENELHELMDAIQYGYADDVVKKKFAEELKARLNEDIPSTESEKKQLQKIFNQIELEPERKIAVPRIQSQAVRRSGRFKKKKIRRIMAVAAMVLVAAIASWYVAVWQNPEPGRSDAPVIYSGVQQITLPDGSMVLLNDSSSLKYQETVFGEINREVWLEGEGFFDVEHNASSPFIVHTGAINTTVLGTSFSISEDDQEVTVSVSRGIVEVGDDRRTYDKILSDEQLAVNKTTRKFKKIQNPSDPALDWKNRFIVLDNIKLEDAAKKIGDRFGVTVHISNEELREVHVSATFLREQGIEHIIQSICLITESSYTINDKHIEIKGGLNIDQQ